MAARIKYTCDKFGAYDLYAPALRGVLRISFLIELGFFSYFYSPLVSLFYSNFVSIFCCFLFLSSSIVYISV